MRGKGGEGAVGKNEEGRKERASVRTLYETEALFETRHPPWQATLKVSASLFPFLLPFPRYISFHGPRDGRGAGGRTARRTR